MKNHILKILAGALILASCSLTTAFSQIISPSGGIDLKPYTAGQKIEVKWNNFEIKNDVNVKLWKASSGVYISLAENVLNTGKYEVVLPDNIQPGNDYKIALFNSETKEFIYNSKTFFKIDPLNINTGSKVEYDYANNLSVSPNPVGDEFKISAESKINGISLLNILGASVYTRSNIDLNEVTINSADLPKGCYVVKIEFENGSLAFKNIVK